MSATETTFQELSDSVTGFDELAIEKHLGMDMYTDGEKRPVMLMRAMVFVHMRHQGIKDTEARQACLGMPAKAVNDYFASDDEIEPEEPVTDAGKDESLPETRPSPGQVSAS